MGPRGLAHGPYACKSQKKPRSLRGQLGLWSIACSGTDGVYPKEAYVASVAVVSTMCWEQRNP